MNIPPELIDEIVRNLAFDIRSLRSCSLIVRSWAYSSRKWLFKDVLVSRKTHQLWLDRIAPTNVELLRNIQTFTYLFDTISMWHGTKPCLTPYHIGSLCSYLPSFRCLERLRLHYMLLGPEVPQQIGLFSAVQQSLSSLYLSDCLVTSNALITLVNYLPLLVDLELRYLRHEANGEPAPQLSRPLRGRLCIAYCETEDRALFGTLSNPPPELDELVLFQVHLLTFYDCIVGARGGNVKRLIMNGNKVSGPEGKS